MGLIINDFTFAESTNGTSPQRYGFATTCGRLPYSLDATMTINLTGTMFHLEKSVSNDVKMQVSEAVHK